MTKVDAAHDKGEFVDDALAIPSKVDERAGQNRTDDVKEWCHGSALRCLGIDALKFLSDGIEYHVKCSSDCRRVLGCLGDAVGVMDCFFD